ncbi:c-type cytochrome [Comamonas flocculans]|uniref:Cytochrome C n=1 Tax=Comamonas flocculans TaxID=2597701 RepID=A0A5B8RS23_9BURK|nr:c-type cytochrome [Comamonas flocculans]QEA11873.1 cytochrome C [Comamonas flocculans]
MSSLRDALAAGLLAATLALPAWSQGKFPNIGRDATPAEVAAWDIDVRPDLQGLPAGSGSVDDGQDLWEARCATCHGIFGESNAVFNPLVGGTSADDIKSGHVANLQRPDYPGRTTFMKVPTLSTLWDYIRRAMPWDNPKSLSTNEVYAATAYLLHLADIVPADFVLSDKNMAEVQQKLPNRKGMTTQHALWPGNEFGAGKLKPDTQASACMKDCGPAPTISSELPGHARNVWGNLREQNRTVGPQRGADTTRPEGKLGDAAGPVKVVGPAGEDSPHARAIALTQQLGCTGCHNMQGKLVGPSFADIAQKYAGKTDYLQSKIRAGGSGVWGDTPMPPQDAPAADIKVIAEWLAAGGGK